ncbi:MAG: Hsp70 family protein [Acidimicrobiales bacterium]
MSTSYALGVDLGTTFTAAAVHRGGRVTMVELGARSSVIPTVVLVRPDGSALVGEAAERRALTEPEGVAREFKRRFGDPTPLLLAGGPHSPEALMSRVLRHVLERVAELEGGPPAAVALTHPANWGPHKLDVLDQTARLAGLALGPGLVHLSEPEAAAIAYAEAERPPVGSRVAVYDLGGGTFDAAVLERSEHGYRILGEPEGIERLGGIDFDEAVFRHAAASAGVAFDPAEDAGAAAWRALRLRRECHEAKEALSSDTSVMIPVDVAGGATAEVRLTRAEFEDMIRPALGYTVEALRRAVASAGLTASSLDAVLLVGGSSRAPLVAELVTRELGAPVALDVHPKHAVAQGAAIAAARAAEALPPALASPPAAGSRQLTERPDQTQPTVQAGPPPPRVAPRDRVDEARATEQAEAVRLDTVPVEPPGRRTEDREGPPPDPRGPLTGAPDAASGGVQASNLRLLIGLAAVLTVVILLALRALFGGADGSTDSADPSPTVAPTVAPAVASTVPAGQRCPAPAELFPEAYCGAFLTFLTIEVEVAVPRLQEANEAGRGRQEACVEVLARLDQELPRRGLAVPSPLTEFANGTQHATLRDNLHAWFTNEYDFLDKCAGGGFDGVLLRRILDDAATARDQFDKTRRDLAETS